MDFALEIGNNIRKQREKLKISIEEAASLADLSTNHLGTIERGETIPRVDTLYRIAKALNIDMQFLIEGFEKSDNKTNIEKLMPFFNSLDEADFDLFNNFVKDYLLWKKKK